MIGLLSIFPQLTFIVLVLTASVLLYVNKSLNYWQKRKVKSIKTTIPFGNLENPFTSKQSQGVQYRRHYEELKKLGVKYGGLYSFTSPIFFPMEPELIKSVLTKDFTNFHARGFYSNEKDQPISAHLFSVDGVKWRSLRTKFTPVFTSGKMKGMFQMVSDCSVPMRNALAKYASKGKPVDIKHVASCYTADVIGSCAFGLDCNSFKDPEFKLMQTVNTAMLKGTTLLKGTFCFSFQDLSRKLGIMLFPKEEIRYFSSVITDTVEHRETHKIHRNDFLQLLINLKNKKSDGADVDADAENLTIEEIAAQSFLFFMAGFETSSSTMTFCLYELAQNQQIQQKARDEINTVLAKHNGEITYDAIGEMKYLQQVVDETLRKYPSVPILNRKCTEDYTIPDTDTIIEKDTQTIISVLGLHYDPEYFPEPEKFDPDRFTDESKSQRHPYAYLPFGEGPRHCIGLRFGIMQAKAGLSVLLKNFSFSLNSKTKVPLHFTTKFLLAARDDILLNVQDINK